MKPTSCGAPDEAERQGAAIDSDVGGVAGRSEAESPHPPLAERTLVDDGDFRRGGKARLVSRSFDDEAHRQAGAEQGRLLQVLEGGDRPTVDRLDQIADLEAGQRGGRARFDRADARRLLGAAEDDEQGGEDRDGKKEIGERARRHDRGAIGERLAGEGRRALLGRHRRHAVMIGRARRVGVAVEFDVAADRNGGQTPARAVFVNSRVEFRAEPQGERVYLHPAPPSDQVMAKLVEENDRGHHNDERQDIPPDPRAGGLQFLHKRHSQISESRASSGGACPSWLPIG